MSIYAVLLLDKDGHFKPMNLGRYSGCRSEFDAIHKAKQCHRGMFNRFETGKFYFDVMLVDSKDQPRSAH